MSTSSHENRSTLSAAARTGPIAGLARLSVHHHRLVLAGWVVALAVLASLVSAAGGKYLDDFTMPGAGSTRATDLLKQHFPQLSGDTATLVVRADSGLNDPGVQGRLQQMLTAAKGLPEVVGISQPEVATTGDAAGKIAYVTIQYDTQARLVDPASVTALEDLATKSAGNGLQVEVGGTVVSASENASTQSQDSSEAIGLIAAVLILLFTFGSFVATGLPLITALIGLSSGLLVLGIANRLIDFGTITPAFVAMIGLGVGIDYALFLVTRHREGLAAGMSVEDAAITAVDTSGRAVLAAGSVVIIALLGLYAIGIPFIGNLGAAAAIVVALSIAVALTLMPAMLGAFGTAIDRWRIGRFYHSGSSGDATGGFGYTLSRQIQRRPWWYGFAALVILLILAEPVIHLQLGFADDGTKPESMHSRRAYDLLVEGFGPGATGPLLIAVEHGASVAPASFQAETQQLAQVLAKTPGVQSVAAPLMSPDGTTAVFRVVPTSGPSDPATADLVHTLRDDIIPAALASGDTRAYVGGTTAVFVDVGDRTDQRMPYFFLIVIGLSFCLLMAVFRSLAIPTTAAIMNLLSIGASYGVLVAVFQWGWGASLIGVHRTAPIETYLPMILFAILFGLSTDYEVFLLSRIREHYVAGSDSREAVAEGLATTTRIITAAAMIMVIVFLAFLTNDSRVIKEFGFGMAVAVLVDATIVRMVLVPSTMELLGDANWWFPGWLDRVVPRLNVEGELAPVPAPAPGD